MASMGLGLRSYFYSPLWTLHWIGSWLAGLDWDRLNRRTLGVSEACLRYKHEALVVGDLEGQHLQAHRLDTLVGLGSIIDF